MNNIENRIKKLEQRPEANKPKAIIVYVCGKSETETEAAKQKAIAEYKSKHPDWEPSPNDMYMQVLTERAKELTEEIASGVEPHKPVGGEGA